MAGGIVLNGDGRTVSIKDVQIQDEDVYQFLQEGEEDRREDRLISAIRIGVVGLRRMAVGQELDYVEKEFGQLLVKFESMFDPAVETSHLGKLSKLMREYFGKGGTVESMFDPAIETSHLGKLSKLMREYFGRGGTVENIFDPTGENTPLSKLKREILGEIKELRDTLSKKKAEEGIVDRTTLKGYAFEDACEEILGEFVSTHMGDELERKTTEIGDISGSFAGDFVITLGDGSGKSIVLETKDWQTVTLPQIMESLERAIENRGAKYGIFVSKHREALPNKVGWFNEYRGNMLVCAMGSREADTFFPDLLNVACQWAKLKLEREISVEEKALETIAEGIREIEAKLDGFAQIKRQCTNVETATQEIRNLAEDLKEGIRGQLTSIQLAIAAVAVEEG